MVWGISCEGMIVGWIRKVKSGVGFVRISCWWRLRAQADLVVLVDGLVNGVVCALTGCGQYADRAALLVLG